MSRKRAIATRRIYEAPAPGDGYRILVDRLWPRGLKKEAAAVDFWAKSISPSNELRRWYGHDPAKWDAFRERYTAELDANPEGLAELRSHLEHARVTFVFSSKETELNNATALKLHVEERGT